MALLSSSHRGAGEPVRGPVLLVVNPASRRGAALGGQVEGVFRARGVPHEVVRTVEGGHAARVALEKGTRFDAVFALGGDGTVMEVVGALAGTGQRVGILPGGTGNLIARTLGIPLDARRAAGALLDGAEAWIDLGRLEGGRCFAFAAGIGVDAQMIAHTPAGSKRRFGVLAYAATAARGVLRQERFLVRATVDGCVYERAASSVMVANFGRVLHGLVTLGPGIREDDGLLDLCIFSPDSRSEAVGTMVRLARRDFSDAPHLLWVQGRDLRVETFPPRLAQADGELLGAVPLAVTVEPLAARLLVPGRGLRG